MTRLRQLAGLVRLLWRTLRTPADGPGAEWVAIDDLWLELCPKSRHLQEQRRYHLERWVQEAPPMHRDSRRAWITQDVAYRMACADVGLQPASVAPGMAHPYLPPRVQRGGFKPGGVLDRRGVLWIPEFILLDPAARERNDRLLAKMRELFAKPLPRTHKES